MVDNLEVYFCDLCNASVPQADLDSGAAVRVKGKVLGRCCVAGMASSVEMPRQMPTPSMGASGSGGLGRLASTVLVLAAVVVTALYLDRRLREEASAVRQELQSVEDSAASNRDRLEQYGAQMTQSLRASDLDGIKASLADLPSVVGAGEGRLNTRIDSLASRLDGIGQRLEALRAEQRVEAAEGQRLVREVQLLGEEVAALAARPRPAPADETDGGAAAVGSGAPGFMEEVLSLRESSEPGVPPELEHHITKLSDPDPGTRFEAVDRLIESADPAILDRLVAMAKDSDPFVRRLTVEGLSDFRQAASVDTLLVAMADEEGIVRHAAYSSLRKLTGQSIPFDPDAKGEDRRAAQRRWQEWWRANKETF